MKITTIYTRRGDEGQTDLVGGVRIRKTDARIEAYGTIDELSSHIGLLLSLLHNLDDERQRLVRTQNHLFNVGTHLATDQSQTPLYASAMLPRGAIEDLEQAIDHLNAQLPEPQGFILPGGTQAAAQCHVCRTVCRRAERRICELAESAQVGPEIIQYVNRLSDYLFILAKIINFNTGQPEITWQNACR
ncbi:MAG: cob(I)yrinic acid a,c-diamide adenosyltransferase [Prevotella sp.]|nr:cob(I)yrinic acid a,c-diamide adenosyltransferase [Prevotella sp.]